MRLRGRGGPGSEPSELRQTRFSEVREPGSLDLSRNADVSGKGLCAGDGLMEALEWERRCLRKKIVGDLRNKSGALKVFGLAP